MCQQGTEKKIVLTDGRIKSCDECIQPLVQALNDCGAQTTASCCGHGKRPSNIILTDGRELHIFRNWKEGRMVDGLFPPLHWWKQGSWRYKVKMNIARWLLNRKVKRMLK